MWASTEDGRRRGGVRLAGFGHMRLRMGTQRNESGKDGMQIFPMFFTGDGPFWQRLEISKDFFQTIRKVPLPVVLSICASPYPAVLFFFFGKCLTLPSCLPQKIGSISSVHEYPRLWNFPLISPHRVISILGEDSGYFKSVHWASQEAALPTTSF